MNEIKMLLLEIEEIRFLIQAKSLELITLNMDFKNKLELLNQIVKDYEKTKD